MGDGPWVLGETYSACDHVLHQHCAWIERPASDFPTLGDYPNLAAFVPRVRERSRGIRRMLERMRELAAAASGDESPP